MINKSVFCVDLTVVELKELLAIKDWSGKQWDSPPNPNIDNIKSKIRAQLENVQTSCAYCGLKLKGTSRGQIEHIAPKAYYRYPQFTFTLLNLVMACGYCNGFDKKGTSDTIGVVERLYKKCEFNIVHPYFHDPNDHYEWTDNNIEVLIQVKNGSSKGLNSINLFELDTPKMNELRAQQIRFEELKNTYQLSQADEDLLDEIINQ
ncbi:HNH endonuclease [Lacinutrix cladophorae]